MRTASPVKTPRCPGLGYGAKTACGVAVWIRHSNGAMLRCWRLSRKSAPQERTSIAISCTASKRATPPWASSTWSSSSVGMAADPLALGKWRRGRFRFAFPARARRAEPGEGAARRHGGGADRGLYGFATVANTPSATPADFSAPRAGFLVLYRGERAIACGGIKAIGPGMGEIKRMYVVPGRAQPRPRAAAAAGARGSSARARTHGGAARHRQTASPTRRRSTTRPAIGGSPTTTTTSYASYWFEKDLWERWPRRAPGRAPRPRGARGATGGRARTGAPRAAPRSPRSGRRPRVRPPPARRRPRRPGRGGG